MAEITPIEGGCTPDEMADAMREIMKSYASHLEFAKFTAAMTRQYYLSLLENGFSKKEALDLAKQYTFGG